jgi:hypothetical protein
VEDNEADPEPRPTRTRTPIIRLYQPENRQREADGRRGAPTDTRTRPPSHEPASHTAPASTDETPDNEPDNAEGASDPPDTANGPDEGTLPPRERPAPKRVKAEPYKSPNTRRAALLGGRDPHGIAVGKGLA